MKRLIQLAFLFCTPLWAATHYATPSGSGTHAGTDWSNACAGLTGNCSPNSGMVRGDTYYVGGGSYSAVTFEIAESGTSLITIKGATAADHGTATGWVSSLGVDVTPASLAYPMNVFNGYVTFDGNTGSGTTGSSYGFTVPQPGSCSSVNAINVGSGPSTIHNVTLSHFYLPGCIADTQTQGIALQTQTTAIGFTYSHNYLNNWQNAIFDFNGTNLTITHNIITNGQSYSDHHGELLDFLNSETNLVFSYNQVLNCAGTACFAANDTGSQCAGGISGAIYGNTFNSGSDIGNGIVGPTSRCYFTNTSVYNNTFTGTTSGLPWFQGCVPSAAACSDATGNVVENNIVWSAACALTAGDGIATHDYNAYLSCVDSAPTETHGQVESFNPFIASGSNNYGLLNPAVASCTSSSAVCGGTSLSSPYNIDPNGNTYGAYNGFWERGAFAYAGAAPPVLGSPQMLQVQ